MRVLLVVAVSALSACKQAPQKTEWFDKQATPAGRYHDMKFVDGDDRDIQALLIRLEKLEAGLKAEGDDGPADVDARRTIRTLAREAQGRSLIRVAEHIVWKFTSRAGHSALHETYLLDFLARCQEVIFELSGDDAPTIENLGSYCLNASRRASFLRILIDKANHALANLGRETGVMYAALVCDILERAEWGAVNRIAREHDPESPAYRKTTVDALAQYRTRIGRQGSPPLPSGSR